MSRAKCLGGQSEGRPAGQVRLVAPAGQPAPRWAGQSVKASVILISLSLLFNTLCLCSQADTSGQQQANATRSSKSGGSDGSTLIIPKLNSTTTTTTTSPAPTSAPSSSSTASTPGATDSTRAPLPAASAVSQPKSNRSSLAESLDVQATAQSVTFADPSQQLHPQVSLTSLSVHFDVSDDSNDSNDSNDDDKHAD